MVFHETSALGVMETWLCALSLDLLYDTDLISVMADGNTGRSKRQVMRLVEEPTSNRRILTYHYEVHVAHYDGFRIITPLTLRFVLYKLRFHETILSASGHRISWELSCFHLSITD